MILFAYASNMDVTRFAESVPSAKKIGIAHLPGHRFEFSKTADDDSSKSNITLSKTDPTESVWGVLIAIDDNERHNFYDPNTWSTGLKLEPVNCVDEQGEIYKAEAFFAQHHAMSAHVLPYDWYHKKIILLAEKAGLPAEYIQKISLLPFKVDPDEKRRAKRLKKLGL